MSWISGPSLVKSSEKGEGQKKQTMSGICGTAKEGYSNCSKGWLRDQQERLQGPKDRSGNVREIFLANLKFL